MFAEELMLVSVQKLWPSRGPGDVSCWQLNLVMCESHAGGAGFEGMKWVGVASSRGSVPYVRARVPEESPGEGCW